MVINLIVELWKLAICTNIWMVYLGAYLLYGVFEEYVHWTFELLVRRRLVWMEKGLCYPGAFCNVSSTGNLVWYHTFETHPAAGKYTAPKSFNFSSSDIMFQYDLIKVGGIDYFFFAVSRILFTEVR